MLIQLHQQLQIVYTVDVTDANNCAVTSTAEVTVNALPNISKQWSNLCRSIIYNDAIRSIYSILYSMVVQLQHQQLMQLIQ